MFLKRLELMGFKSFPKRTELTFEPGITAVVGPNGSGKSNIADAIRWVLGEQSAKSLRGGKMEDVIFSGSDSRKPVNFCEVSLTLDNADQSLKTDYSEVTITRRVYRSGESEYYLNKQSCRLRDIVELFMDTGVGKEAYSMIGQGKIEEIVGAKAEDRRGIFEEAAGIVKYKTRKKEAEKKLEETAANLARVHDIMNEISNQLEPLRRQAEAAERYLALRSEEKELEIGLAVHRIERLRQEWEGAKLEADRWRDQLAELSAEMAALEARASKVKWERVEREERLERQRSDFYRVREEADRIEAERQILKERSKNVLDKYEQTKRTATEQQRQLVQIEARQKEQARLLRQSMIEAEEIAKRLAEKQRRLEEVDQHLIANVERLQTDYIDLVNQNASIDQERRHLEQLARSLEQRKQALIDELNNVEAQARQASARARQFRDEFNERQTDMARAEARLSELSEKHKQANKKWEESERQFRQIEKNAQTLQSRIDVLVETQTSYIGFQQGAKEVLKAKQKELQGIHGSVAELLTVPAPYATAIEIALGGSMQQIVAENESVAKAAIQWLKDRRLGRATFLPLDVIRPRRVPKDVENQLRGTEGFIGVASDLIDCAPQYRPVYEHLLGMVLVMKNLRCASVAARRFRYRYRFVSLEGDVVNPGGALTGGLARNKNVALLGRSSQIDELKRQLKRENERKAIELERMKRNKEDARQLSEKIEETRRFIEQSRLGKQVAKERMTRYEMEWNGLNDKLNELKSELVSADDQIQAVERRRVGLLRQSKKGGDQQLELKETLDKLEHRRIELEREKEKHQAEMTELKIRAAREEQRQAAIRSERQRLEEERESLRQSLFAEERSLEALRKELADYADQQREREQRLSELLASKESLASDVERLLKERKDGEALLHQLESDAKLIRKQSKQLEEKLHQAELKASRREVALDNQLDQLFEEHGLSYEMAKEARGSRENPESLEERLRNVKQQLASLGEANVGAIEAYNRQWERYQFLQEQSEDLEQARQTLDQMIDEMEKAMSRQFSRAFEQIRSEFQQVFRRLFGGGRADICLSNPDELLSAGIEIVAQPPGKRLQNLTLLSGGEKALTAIALLFAIQRVKPVPFCVLDEVEAALDEANVDRFVQYLRELSDRTQFICITHRKGTMEGADALYGVTMQESGVSKLVSVKLEERVVTA